MQYMQLHSNMDCHLSYKDQLLYRNQFLCSHCDKDMYSFHSLVHFYTWHALGTYQIHSRSLHLDSFHQKIQEDICIGSLLANRYKLPHYNKAMKHIRLYQFHIDDPNIQLDRNCEFVLINKRYRSYVCEYSVNIIPLNGVAHWNT